MYVLDGRCMCTDIHVYSGGIEASGVGVTEGVVLDCMDEDITEVYGGG